MHATGLDGHETWRVSSQGQEQSQNSPHSLPDTTRMEIHDSRMDFWDTHSRCQKPRLSFPVTTGDAGDEPDEIGGETM